MERRKEESVERVVACARERESAGAREYVTGMARGQLTFIILTLMDYLIPYIPYRPFTSPVPLPLFLFLSVPLHVSRHPSRHSPKYRIIFMDVFELMLQGVPEKREERGGSCQIEKQRGKRSYVRTSLKVTRI